MKKKQSKFDIRHKETLTLFLREYFELFFPDIAGKIKFETAKFLDKELIALFGETKKKDQHRITDALILVEAEISDKKQPELIMIHWEQESQRKNAHGERMFHYFCGIYFKFRLPVFPIAMYTDPHKWRKPVKKKFKISLFKHTVSEYNYHLIKLKDFKASEFEKKADENPLASAYLPLTDYPKKDRPVIKAKAVKGIAKKLPPGKKQSTLYSLIQESMKLNKYEEKQYRELIRTDPTYKEAKMLESIEEVGREQGILIGEILMAQRILKQDVYSTEDLEYKGIDELESILAEIGKPERLETGTQKGVLIGEILMAQRILKQNIHSQKELENKNLDELSNILAEFEGKLN
ncbi:MAG: hypothetical protein GY795_49975 [Desulfobacterales bacterium]|nr:hypothetical protein [Desulfobacterales bacterium]